MTIKTSVIIITILVITGGNISCVKKDPISRIAQIFMVPLSPDAAAVDFEINNQIFATSVGYSTTVGTATYTLPYYTITPGTTSIKYNITGQKTPYASISSDILEDNAYSTYLIDSAKKTKLALVRDDLELPTPGKVKLRFFHFSPNAPAVDVTYGTAATKLFINRSFNDQEGNQAFQSFIEIDPGIYQFAFRLTGTSTAAYTTSSLNLLPDRIYTLAARGFVGGTTNRALGGWIYANRP